MGLDERQETKKLENTEVTENPKNVDESENIPKEEVIKKSLNSTPLEQRAGRRQRGAKKQENKTGASDKKLKDEDETILKDKPDSNNSNLKDKTTPKLDLDSSNSKMKASTVISQDDSNINDEPNLKAGSDEKSDLEFLDSIDKPKQEIDIVEEKKGVVPVKIVKEQETANLEDWLDDFLDD
jgi:hypothetical protein